jgi:thiamine biosynthesis lipoprotein
MGEEEESTLTWGTEPVADLLRFPHQAMATTFEILACHPKPAYARQAALEAFGLVDRLEQQLSRFVAHSDISRVNAAPCGESVLVSPDTLECLQQARAAYDLTCGAFDASVGAWMPPPEHGSAVTSPKAGMDLIRLDTEAMTVTRLDEAVQLDLGAIGNGFALDKMALLLIEWGIKTALVHGGGSTALALEPPPGREGWPVTLTCPFEPRRQLASLDLRIAALSGSAQIRQRHIVDPRTGLRPVTRPATWAWAPTGAQADALSTAYVVMDPARVEQLCAANPAIGALVITRDETANRPICQARSFGNWLAAVPSTVCECSLQKEQF